MDMKKKKILFLLISLFFINRIIYAQIDPDIQYQKLSQTIISGWNTWDNRSIATHVLLPEGLAFQFVVHDTLNSKSLPLVFTGNRADGSEKVRTIAHTPDGSYTHFYMIWHDFAMELQTVAKNNDLFVKVTPDYNYKNPGYIASNAQMIYGGEAKIKLSSSQIEVKLESKKVDLFLLTDENSINQDQRMGVNFDGISFFSTDSSKSSDELNQLFNQAEQDYYHECFKYQEMSEVYDIIQNSINWLVVYDHKKSRAVTPVSRPWSYGWGGNEPGGFVLFCWDNFFVSYMHAINSKELAFNEAIQMCNEIDDLGFVPNFSGPNDLKSRDRSQPPVGSMMVLAIYHIYPEKWFLEKVFRQLLTWNRWWEKNRDFEGYLCWGSHPFEPKINDKRVLTQNNFPAASNESGLDNTPMYDDVQFNQETHLLEMADVGLMGLYIADCKALAKIAKELGQDLEYRELMSRAKKYDQKLQTLWDDDLGMFLNMHTDTKKLSQRISPTNFYPLLSKSATQSQAKRMIEEHFYNPDEFWGEWVLPSIVRSDTAYTGEDYWRGSIWAPMNFLVYLGLQNYDLPQARKDLADKSRMLLLKEWRARGFVRENYHAETGGAPEKRSDHFYHWGALLGMINLIEYDKVVSPMGNF